MKNIDISLIIRTILLGLFFFVLLSCDDDTDPYVDSEDLDCYYCYEEDPEYMDVKLIFNMQIDVDTVFFTVYSGFAFNSEVFMQSEATENETWIEVKSNQDYTVVAEYIDDDNTYHVINDFYPKTEYFQYACDDPCYYVHEIDCDLSFKP